MVLVYCLVLHSYSAGLKIIINTLVSNYFWNLKNALQFSYIFMNRSQLVKAILVVAPVISSLANCIKYIILIIHEDHIANLITILEDFIKNGLWLILMYNYTYSQNTILQFYTFYIYTIMYSILFLIYFNFRSFD